MAYTAKLNGTTFFDTTQLKNNNYLLTSAVLDMAANSSGKFTFTIPVVNPVCDNFVRLLDYVDVYRDADLIFSGRVFSISELFNNSREIVCEGLMAMLGDSIFRPVEFTGTLHNLFRAIVTSHNNQVDATKRFAVGNITVDNQNVYRKYDLYETSLSRLKDLVEIYGGYLMIRKLSNATYLDWIAEFTSTSTQTIEFKSNILDLTRKTDSADICTVVIPLGAMQDDGTRLTIKSVNSGNDYIEVPAALMEDYGHIVKTVTFDEITDANDLRIQGLLWMSRTLLKEATINVTAVDLAEAGYNVQNFKIGQKITVTSAPNGIVATDFDVQAQKLDLLRPASNRLVLGTQSGGYIDIQRHSQPQIESIIGNAVYPSQLDTAINDLSQLLTGQEGGFFVQRDTNNDGYIDEVLFMDTTDINTARNVWRFNSAGWGYSSNGYAGPYTTGASINGGIVGSFIQAGTVTADRIAANEVFTQALEAQNFKITGGSFQIAAAGATTSYIDIYRNLTSGTGLQTQISAQQIAKRGFYNGTEQSHSLLSSTSLQIENLSTNKKSSVYTDYIETPRVKITDGLFSGQEKQISLTIAAGSYVEAYEALTATSGYEISGFGGFYLSYGSTLNVYRAEINASRARFYYGVSNTSSSSSTTTLYYSYMEARTQ